MLIEIPKDKNEYRSVWDKPVGIVKVNSYLYRVYILDEIYAPVEYGELVELFHDLDDDVTVEVYLNTNGGSLDSAIMLIDAMKNSNARVIGKLSGMVASAGTMLTMAFDEVEVAPYTSFMIHNYSSSGGGAIKGNELKVQQAFTEKETAKLFREVYKGFLTPREIKKVINDQDMWMDKEEVEKRFAKKLEME